MEIGRLGVSTWLDAATPPQAVEFSQKIEALGYSALWIPEALGRDPFALLSYLAPATRTLALATGVANVYSRDAVTVRSLSRTLAALSGGRFLLGLGVSHRHLVEKIRGHRFESPVAAATRFLDAFESAPYQVEESEPDPPVVLAALRPRMLKLAGERTQGAHTYFAPPAHTARARQILGEGPKLYTGQFILLESDAARARAVARKNIGIYLRLEAYRGNLLTLGFDPDDFEGGGSDRLIDAVVAWGPIDAIADRIAEHLDAGADHVCVQPYRPDGQPGPDLAALEALASRTDLS